ncbi:alpha/beta fold hydrolase [Streptomyces daliensis]|uniref:Alpha/beta fold hydrolase n=1 Tax=Streptomyces daliensis TaxID=299421 RepID=A0A8T4J1A2_9ACTN|nr:alpha/beta fold hydrolase [Streptomyces daliensis]
MPTVEAGGTQLSYQIRGSGVPLVLIAPAASPAAVWDRYQVPALVRAGHQVVTFDNRGSRPSAVPPGPYTLEDFTADTVGLIKELGVGPCLLAGVSLGAMIAQEVASAYPELVRGLALMATRGRGDAFRDALARSGAEAMRAAGRIPAEFAAVATMSQLFGPATLADDRLAKDWLTTFTLFPQHGEGWAAQYESTIAGDRLAGLAAVRCPSLVLAFAHDVVMPPTMGRAVADAIPGCRYEELAGCGHFGFLERPDEVNRILTDFFRTVV